MQFDCFVWESVKTGWNEDEQKKIGATTNKYFVQQMIWFSSSFASIGLANFLFTFFRHHFCRRFPSDSFRNFHSNFVLIIFRLLSSKKIYQLTQSFERIAFFPLSFYLCIVRRWVGTKFAIQKSSLSRQALALWLLALVLIYCLQPLWLESNHLISKCSV